MSGWPCRGRAVNDVSNLLAELLENATYFSSPTIEVTLSSSAIPEGGIRLSIHDLGIGLPDDQLASINEHLVSPPPSTAGRRLGIVIVARLAHRHGIHVELQPRDTGGTVDHLALPRDILDRTDGTLPAALYDPTT